MNLNLAESECSFLASLLSMVGGPADGGRRLATAVSECLRTQLGDATYAAAVERAHRILGIDRVTGAIVVHEDPGPSPPLTARRATDLSNLLAEYAAHVRAEEQRVLEGRNEMPNLTRALADMKAELRRRGITT